MRPEIYADELRGLPKKERKALQREVARIQREEELKRRKRNRILVRSSLIVVGIAIIAVVALVVTTNIRTALAGPANMASDGIGFTGDGTNITPTTNGALQVGDTPSTPVLTVASGVLTVVIYVDYSNADSATFETTNGATVQGWVKQGYATLDIHPVALGSSGSDAATRAANTAACVANSAPGSFLAVHNALVADQAAITGDGFSNDDAVALVTKAGVTDAAITSCITNNEYDNWVNDVTKRATASLPNSNVPALTAVPTVLIDGEAYTGSLSDATAFETFVSDTYTKNTPASTATPTPTPDPTTGG